MIDGHRIPTLIGSLVHCSPDIDRISEVGVKPLPALYARNMASVTDRTASELMAVGVSRGLTIRTES